MAEDYRKYMEGNYEGNFVKQYMQMEDDKKRAEQIAEEVKAVQEAALESEKKDCRMSMK